ncbi:hypothetical protein AXF42_Ash015998 [Apostasia shenzhenica]|uniref:Origin recognition complex subunit 1 n=1 Tax=Apostasia shenzhenica TaxID=1088818 RepID=A0A2I0AWN4_9ASPA|nr:hypothetical protein AXF42_Ash015998 [Apostasia shenzhenica]
MDSTPRRFKPKQGSAAMPPTPGSAGHRRSLRLASSPRTPISEDLKLNSEDKIENHGSTRKSRRSLVVLEKTPSKPSSFAPATPNQPESRKRRRSGPSEAKKLSKKRSYYKKVVYDGGEFGVGDDVYVKRREEVEPDEDDPEVEECRICFESGVSLMIECDYCLGGFHLRCLKPPLREVPEGDWICGFCEAKKSGKKVELPKPPEGKKVKKTAREKLLSSDLWAAKIESLWKEPDDTYWLKCRWYIIPEETAAGRQPHNLRRELYITNHLSDIEMASVLRHCFVMNPREFAEANNEGDDVFYCEYEYDVHWQSFKRLSDVADADNEEDPDYDEDWRFSSDSGSESEDDSDFDDDAIDISSALEFPSHECSANSRKGRIFGLHKIGLKKIPEHVRLHKPTDLENARTMLMLATLPKSLPCRNKELEEITAFIKGALCEDQCFGRCLYIYGVPGTGKTMTVLTVMRNLRTEVNAGKMTPYCFVEVIYESLTGHRVGWKKALNLLIKRFSEDNRVSKEENQPCVLLVDELDLLLTRNQSVLYNILDWPTKPDSKLIVIGIANTMDLPEKLLPRISSRMGIQRLCFGPYNYQQLQEIISSRLKGIDAFEEQAIEFASRKVAAMSGDARRALEICRRAAELADCRLRQQLQFDKSNSRQDLSNGKYLVGMDDIEAAIQEVFQAPHIQIMKTSSKLSKIMLAAMVHELYRSGLGEITFEKVRCWNSDFPAQKDIFVPCLVLVTFSNTMPYWSFRFVSMTRLSSKESLMCYPEFRSGLELIYMIRQFDFQELTPQ